MVTAPRRLISSSAHRQNNPPAVTNLATDLVSPQVAGAAVTFTATASDTENDPLQYMFVMDGQQRPAGRIIPHGLGYHSRNGLGSHSIEVRAKD